jgi:hypothetical protein
MSETPAIVKNLHVEKLTGFYKAIADTLIMAGLSGGKLNEIFAKHVQIQCVECGIELTGDELSVLAMTPPETGLENPKLERLRQGYCGRKDCSSRYFAVTLSPHPDLQWAEVIARIEQRDASPSPTQPAAGSPGSPAVFMDRPKSPWSASRIRLWVGVVILVVLLLCRYLMSTGSLPGFSAEPKYKVDPASLNQDAR